jgi:hypothetical protein
MSRRLFGVLSCIMVVLFSVSIAFANTSTAPGRASTFHRGITTDVSSWSAVTNSGTQERSDVAAGECEAQTVTTNYTRTWTETTYYTRTLIHRGVAHSNGLVLSDTTAENAMVTYGDWEQDGDPVVSGECVTHSPSGGDENGEPEPDWGKGVGGGKDKDGDGEKDKGGPKK